MAISDDAYKDFWERQQEQGRKFGEKLGKAAAKNREKIIMEALSKAAKNSTLSMKQLARGMRKFASAGISFNDSIREIEKISGLNSEEVIPDEGKEIIGVVKESSLDLKTGETIATIDIDTWGERFISSNNNKEQEERKPKPIDTKKLKRKLVF